MPHSSSPSRSFRRWLIGVAAVVMVVVLALALIVGFGGRGGSGDSASTCADVEFIGAAGSGQREADAQTNLIADDGVGSIVANTYRNLRDDLGEDATVNLRAVEYPARAVPQGADRAAWSEFLNSVSEGADAAEQLITDTLEECGEDAKIVVAGYSQGAMAMHRALEALGPTEQIVAGVLIGDGDKMSVDNVQGLPEYDTASSEGIAQVAKGAGIDSGATDVLLPEEWSAIIIDACADGDVVCAPDSLSLRNLDAHQSYDADDWREDLLGLVSD
ncbi:cutinase family protein [Corynebacterium variabile]|uniref:Putative secreted protein n=1 Tax=Corynebacterium variabile (strain DSM 44702 / CIP 107183 / JCM 12073 / NCIMB 30131) TaxID=858619 RepID=G0HAX7_CORVD|nr:cutinase family protein [Corynebacterium variabile]AEK35793.1 putative secreted protein [Corynebacterium variabile DSM 44702]MDN6660484.1 cutinase family protein [Corynebacterium variabile]